MGGPACSISCSGAKRIDFSPFAQEALEYAFTLAKPLGARVRLVHAMQECAYPLDFALFGVSEAKALRERIHARLDELVAVLKAGGVAAERVCVTGPPADVLLEQLRDETFRSAGAIVMGTHGRRGLSHLALGSVAEFVVRHATCPVFTVKSPRYRHRATREVGDGRETV